MARRQRTARWLLWLALWVALMVLIGLITTRLAGSLLPAAFLWAGSLVLASALMFLLVAPPSEE